MGPLFKDDGQLTRARTLSMLSNDPQDFRRRAAECRKLAETCITSEAEQVLVELAADLDQEAKRLEETAPSGVGAGRY